MVRFPLELDVARWRMEGEAKAAAEGEAAAADGKYVLRAVLVHSGRSTDQGHYLFVRARRLRRRDRRRRLGRAQRRAREGAAEEGKVLGAEAFVLLYESGGGGGGGGGGAGAGRGGDGVEARRHS